MVKPVNAQLIKTNPTDDLNTCKNHRYGGTDGKLLSSPVNERTTNARIIDGHGPRWQMHNID